MDDSKAAHGKELPRLTAEEIVARLESLLQRLGNFSAYVDEIDDEGNVTIKTEPHRLSRRPVGLSQTVMVR